MSNPSSGRRSLVNQTTLGTAIIIIIALIGINALWTYLSLGPRVDIFSTFAPQIIAVILLSIIFLGLRRDT